MFFSQVINYIHSFNRAGLTVVFRFTHTALLVPLFDVFLFPLLSFSLTGDIVFSYTVNIEAYRHQLYINNYQPSMCLK